MKKLSLVAILLLTSCGNPIYPHEWTRAKKVCQQNGGILSVYEGFWTSGLEVKCKNGMNTSLAKIRND